MAKNIKNLSDVLPKELQEGDLKPVEDYLDKELVFHACREVTGSFGKYQRIVVSEGEEGEQFYISTGASQVVEVLNYLKDNRLFPVRAKLQKAGRAILLRPIE